MDRPHIHEPYDPKISALPAHHIPHQLIHLLHREACHPALFRPRLLCQKDVAVVIPIGTASVRKCRPEEGYDGSVDGVCDVEGSGVAGNVKCRYFFQSGEFQEIRLSHKVHGIRGRRELPDGFAHGHFTLGACDDGGDLVLGEFPCKLPPVLDGPFLMVTSGAWDEKDVTVFDAVCPKNRSDSFHFFCQIRKGKLDLVCGAAQITHDV